MKPKVSVIMAVYHHTKPWAIKDAIESILNQTFETFECIIIIDGPISHDVQNILTVFQRADDRVVLEKQSVRRGLAYSLNNGMDLAKGEYIARMDDDEICTLSRLQTQYDILHKNVADILFSNFSWIDEDGEVLSIGYSSEISHKIVGIVKDDVRFCKAIIRSNFISHPTVMFNKRQIAKIGGYRKHLLNSEDYDLWLRSLINKLRFCYCDKLLVHCRVPKRISYNARIAKQTNYYYWNCKILEELKKDLDLVLFPDKKFFVAAQILKIRMVCQLLDILPGKVLMNIIRLKDMVFAYRQRRRI